jgi:glycerate 2-kinase
MAAALERLWPSPLSGAVVTRYGFGCATRSIDILEASHPVPDYNGLAASQRLFNEIRDLSRDDLVIALMTGGGSALLPCPVSSLTFEDEVRTNEGLLASGAPIAAMNAIRRKISRIKGGQLAESTKAQVVTLVVSDVPGDDPALVSSGPTVPDKSPDVDCLALISRYRIEVPPAVLDYLKRVAAGPRRSVPAATGRTQTHVIASARTALEAAAKQARLAGVNSVILSDAIEGESRAIALMHGAIARNTALRNEPFKTPTLILSGGETTVSLRNRGGRGGRNSEFGLALALALEDTSGVFCLAADTDGIDGSETNAGVFVDGTSCRRMLAQGIDPARHLDNNDSYSAFATIADLFVTGPTGTNVNDFRAILVNGGNAAA